jgi:hypothetical protein
MTPQLCNWAYKMCTIPPLLVCIDNTDTDNCPSCRGCSVTLAKSLSLDLEFRASKVR